VKRKNLTGIGKRQNNVKASLRAPSSGDEAAEEAIDVAMGKLSEAICIVRCAQRSVDEGNLIGGRVDQDALCDGQSALTTGAKLLRDAYNRLDTALVNRKGSA
jgi:hypothetical protein